MSCSGVGPPIEQSFVAPTSKLQPWPVFGRLLLRDPCSPRRHRRPRSCAPCPRATTRPPATCPSSHRTAGWSCRTGAVVGVCDGRPVQVRRAVPRLVVADQHQAARPVPIVVVPPVVAIPIPARTTTLVVLALVTAVELSCRRRHSSLATRRRRPCRRADWDTSRRPT